MELLSRIVHCDSTNGSDILQDLHHPYEYCSQASSLLQSVTTKKKTCYQETEKVCLTKNKLNLP